MTKFAELQLLPMMEFSFNTLQRQFSIASLLTFVLSREYTVKYFFQSITKYVFDDSFIV